ncbi:hypothetical protein DITRI_Ditri20bG0020100 [Diplodiscus trichospermus]
MACFKFPKRICQEINSACLRFWWGQKKEERKIHWKNWLKLTLSKNLGGLGFRDLEVFNDALLAKQAWRVLQEPNALWVKILKGLYFHDRDFFETRKGSRASWSWSSLLVGRDFLKDKVLLQGVFFVSSGYHCLKQDLPVQLSDTASSSHTVNPKGIWNERCNVIYNKVQVNVQGTLNKIKSAIYEFLSSHRPLLSCFRKKTKESNQVENWKAPLIGWIKFNCDGGYNPTLKKASIGVVVLDHEGRLIDGMSKVVNADNPLTAEAFEVNEGVKRAVNNGHTNVEFETDSVILCSAVSCSSKDIN